MVNKIYFIFYQLTLSFYFSLYQIKPKDAGFFPMGWGFKVFK